MEISKKQGWLIVLLIMLIAAAIIMANIRYNQKQDKLNPITGRDSTSRIPDEVPLK